MSGRAVWARCLAGTWRGSSWYYWTTDASVSPGWLATAVPSGATAVPLLLDSIPTCSGGAISPLAVAAGDATLSLTFAASAGALAVVAPDLAVVASTRRLGYLTSYAAKADTTLDYEEEQAIAPGDVLYLDGELIEVDSVAVGELTVTRGVYGTTAKTHSSPAADPAVLMDARAVPLQGQILEYGVTDSGVDTVLWRGVVDSATITSGQSCTVRAVSLLSVLRQTTPIVPQGTVPVWSSLPLSEGSIGTLSFVVDDAELPWSLWEYVRVVGKSGDWAIIDLSTVTVLSLTEQLPRRYLVLPADVGVPIIGSKDGVVRVSASGSTVRVRAAAGIVTRTVGSDEEAAAIRREHAIEVLGELKSVEWAGVTSLLYCADVARVLMTGAGLPPRMTPQIPDAWITVQTAAAAQVQYASASDPTVGIVAPLIAPGGSVLDWIATSLLRPGALWIGSDLGQIVIDTWVETSRTVLGVELTTASQDDRGPWSWGTGTRPMLGVQFDDPTSDLEEVRAYGLAAAPRGALAIRSRTVARTVTTGARTLVSADAWLSGQRYVEPVPTPLGLSPSQLDAWEAMIASYGRTVPTISSPMREELSIAIGSALAVELDDAPTTRALVGMVYEVTRDPGTGTMTLSALLPGVGRDTLTLWAPSIVADDVGVGIMTATGPDVDAFAAFVGGDLVVYAPTGEPRCVLSGTGWTAPDTLTWSSATGTPVDGDVVTLADRTPVVYPDGVDGVIGYIANGIEAEGDARWQ